MGTIGRGLLALGVMMLAAMPAPAQTAAETAALAAPSAAAPPARARDPFRGAVTGLPLPRYVTLKTSEGNARRGPGTTHRIDWVFTRAGMPLKVTAEFENWRRVEDAEGLGGWMHYTLLSGSRSALVVQDMVELKGAARDDAPVIAQAELGAVARLLSCGAEWCRIGADGVRGWVHRGAIWGVEPGELID
jgi:SH3-like domain-containing protein